MKNKCVSNPKIINLVSSDREESKSSEGYDESVANRNLKTASVKSHITNPGLIRKKDKSMVSVKTSVFPEDVTDSEESSPPTPQKIPDSSESNQQDYGNIEREHVSLYNRIEENASNKTSENSENNSKNSSIIYSSEY